MNPKQNKPQDEVRRLLAELKVILAESLAEGKKLQWELDELLKAMHDIRNIEVLIKNNAPLRAYGSDANNPNRKLLKYWNAMRDGYGDV